MHPAAAVQIDDAAGRGIFRHDQVAGDGGAAGKAGNGEPREAFHLRQNGIDALRLAGPNRPRLGDRQARRIRQVLVLLGEPIGQSLHFGRARRFRRKEALAIDPGERRQG